MRSSGSRSIVWLAAVALVAWDAPGARGDVGGAPAPKSGCIDCHARLDVTLSAPAKAWADDIHAARGFSCVDCHGGDPAATDKALAKSLQHGWRGALAGRAIIEVCARCHSDATLMKRYAPKQRVDQASEYATSVHGQRLATGDTRVATCASCHHAHGIRAVSDAKSPVFPLNVADTCGRCHADPAHMQGYKLPDGKPLPTNQRDEYMQSVHYAALAKRNDLSAPTCNDCHGNHGATPPGVGAVVNVCGTCHAVFAQRFEASPHKGILDRGCVECHSNHAIHQPADDMLGTQAPAVCLNCHSEGDDGLAAAGRMRAALDKLRSAVDHAEQQVAAVHNAGMEVGDQELAVHEARTKITETRTEVHTFDPQAVEAVVQTGLKITTDIDRAAQGAFAEVRFRRQGLAVSTVVILLVVVALWFKIRQIERKQSAEEEGAA